MVGSFVTQTGRSSARLRRCRKSVAPTVMKGTPRWAMCRKAWKPERPRDFGGVCISPISRLALDGRECHADSIVGRGKGVVGGRPFVFNGKWRNVEVTGGRWPGRIRRTSLAFGRDVAIVLGYRIGLSPVGSSVASAAAGRALRGRPRAQQRPNPCDR